MPLADLLLYWVARSWPSPVRRMNQRLGAEPGTDAWAEAYSREQFEAKVRGGLGHDVRGKDVVELGCGHGGVSCFLATAGARSVVGVDVDRARLGYAVRFRSRLEEERRARLPVRFVAASADSLPLRDASVDVVIADNLMEHVVRPAPVLSEARRVLRPSGALFIPIFSSILSKHGLHLKHGIKVPWANLLFSERTIVRAMQRLARRDPGLVRLYPGLERDPRTVADLRAHRDLNDIDYRSFRRMAHEAGFAVERFEPFGTAVGRVLRHVPLVNRSVLIDVFSTGASATLRPRGPGGANVR